MSSKDRTAAEVYSRLSDRVNRLSATVKRMKILSHLSMVGFLIFFVLARGSDFFLVWFIVFGHVSLGLGLILLRYDIYKLILKLVQPPEGQAESK